MKLCLQGTGYLEGICRNNGFSAQIRLLIQSNNAKVTDEILLYANIKSAELLSILADLEAKRLKGHTIVLEFCALYQYFRAHFNGMVKEDATNMLMLQGELQSLDGWYEEHDGMCFGQTKDSPEYLSSHIV